MTFYFLLISSTRYSNQESQSFILQNISKHRLGFLICTGRGVRVDPVPLPGFPKRFKLLNEELIELRAGVGGEELTEVEGLQHRDSFVGHGLVPDLLVAGVLGVTQDVSHSAEVEEGRRHLHHFASTGLYQPDGNNK